VPQKRVLPVVAEEAHVKKRTVAKGAVRVERQTKEITRNLDVPLLRERIEVRRVPVNKVVKEPPPIRQLRDKVIVPVVEEEVIITKRLILIEEVHLLRHRTTEHHKQVVKLKREHPVLSRIASRERA